MLDRLLKRQQRLPTVLVEALNLEVQLRALRRDAARDLHLRIEGGARQARQPRRGLAAFRERGEECDVERMRQAEHVGDQPIVLVQIP